MNKNEYYQSVNKHMDPVYKKVQEELKKWKRQYHPNERCCVHHRDDNDEVRAYNEAYYERWGIDESGNFIEGKYVTFMTLSEHSRYHNTGNKHYAYGKNLSAEHKQKISAAEKGKKLSNEAREKISAALKGEKNPYYGKHHFYDTKMKIAAAVKEKIQAVKFLYTTYKENGGEKSWNCFQKALASGDITFEMQPVSVFTNGGIRCV